MLDNPSMSRGSLISEFAKLTRLKSEDNCVAPAAGGCAGSAVAFGVWTVTAPKATVPAKAREAKR